MTETLEVIDGRTTLRIERRFRHPRPTVWEAISEPRHLNAWFPFDVEVDLRVGGQIRFLDRNPEPTAPTEGVVTQLDPPQVFAFTWGPDNALRFELHADGDGCRLVFTHAFADHFGAASFCAGWQVCLDALDADLAGGDAPAPGDMAPTHDRYVAQFGLDDGTVEASDDGWKVRFERQLTRPLDVVWATLTAAGAPRLGSPPPAPFTAEAVDAGAVTVMDETKAVEYPWRIEGAPVGVVRWELGAGTGQGPRLVVTQSGPGERHDLQRPALDAWKARIEALAAALRSA